MAASISDIRALLKVRVLPKSSDSRRVFITGGAGRIGAGLIPILLERGHRVRALTPHDSRAKLPAGCEVVSGDALDSNSYHQLIRPSDTFIHLVGARPWRSKPADLRAIDLVSAQQAINACAEIGMRHFVYLSVTHPVPAGMLKDYAAVRAECEQMIQERKLSSTIVRPWVIVGPGQEWLNALLPFYKLGELIPFTRAAALRLGLVTLDQVILALVDAVESRAEGTRILGVPEIRRAELQLTRQITSKTA